MLNLYGQQESRMRREEIEEHWEEIMGVISRVEAREEHLVLIGDANRHLGSLIPGNIEKVSHGGELMKELLETDKYVLLNSSSKSRNGPWTRIDPADEENKSVLDLVIVSTGLEKYVDKLVIDSKRENTPFKQINGETISFPDHFSLLLTFKRLPVENKSASLGKKFSRWNTNKKEGWENYFKLTDANERLEEIAENDFNNPNFTMKAIEKELNKI